jgi:hypothetical protein
MGRGGYPQRSPLLVIPRRKTGLDIPGAGLPSGAYQFGAYSKSIKFMPWMSNSDVWAVIGIRITLSRRTDRRTTMQYMLLIYGDETIWANMPEAEAKRTMQAYVEYSQALAASGILRGGSELSPVTTATTVRVRNGKTLIADGPFMETKEQLGGYYLIEAANLDEAIKWAAKIPSAGMGSIEIRPQTANQALSLV